MNQEIEKEVEKIKEAMRERILRYTTYNEDTLLLREMIGTAMDELAMEERAKSVQRACRKGGGVEVNKCYASARLSRTPDYPTYDGDLLGRQSRAWNIWRGDTGEKWESENENN